MFYIPGVILRRFGWGQHRAVHGAQALFMMRQISQNIRAVRQEQIEGFMHGFHCPVKKLYLKGIGYDQPQPFSRWTQWQAFTSGG